MPETFKHAIFFLTAPVMIPVLFFFYALYGDDSNGSGWYQDLWDGNWLQWILAVLLAPVFFTVRWFINLTYSAWEELSE